MNSNDFRWIRRGRHLSTPSHEDMKLAQSFKKKTKNHERALLMLHGFSSTPAIYRELIPTIEAYYDRIEVPRLPMHGTHLTDFSNLKKEALIDFAKTTCQKLIKNYKTVDILGLSMGGLLALDLAETFPIHHLFLLAPALAIQGNVTFKLWLAKFLQALGFKTLRSMAGNIIKKDAKELTYRALPLPTIIEMLSWSKNYSFKPPHCPTDLFLGEKDIVINNKALLTLFNAIPTVTIHCLPNAAHALPLEHAVQDIAKIMIALCETKEPH